MTTHFPKFRVFPLLIAAALGGCASVPMAPAEQDARSKQFLPPGPGLAAVYVYRDTFGGQALAKTLSIDGVAIGETANKVFFRREVAAGEHTLATESEFGDNERKFTAVAGQLHFFEQYIKFGVFVGGSNLREVGEEEGRKAVLRCREALPWPASGRPAARAPSDDQD